MEDGDNPYSQNNTTGDRNGDDGKAVNFNYMQDINPFGSDVDTEKENQEFSSKEEEETEEETGGRGDYNDREMINEDITRTRDKNDSVLGSDWGDEEGSWDNLQRNDGDKGSGKKSNIIENNPRHGEEGKQRDEKYYSQSNNNNSGKFQPAINRRERKRPRDRDDDIYAREQSRGMSRNQVDKNGTRNRNTRSRRRKEGYTPSLRRQRSRSPRRITKLRSCCRCSGTSVVSFMIGLILVGAFVWINILSSRFPTKKLFHSYRFQLQDEGIPPSISANVTEEELYRGLVNDVPLTRLAIDLTEYIKENPWRTCMCMHHLTFLPGKGGQDIVPRRFCVLYNKKRGESEVMVNPVPMGRSRDTTEFLQKSRGCHQKDLPVTVKRPEKIWIEWGDMILNYKKTKGERVRMNYAKFTGQEAACLALAIEELDGEMRCGNNGNTNNSHQTNQKRRKPPKQKSSNTQIHPSPAHLNTKKVIKGRRVTLRDGMNA